MKAGTVFVSNIIADMPHRFVCVGSDNNGFVALILATSQIESRIEYARQRKNLNSEQSIVIVDKGTYQSKINSRECSLKKETCFDCNNLLVRYEEKLSHNIVLCDPVSDDLYEMICDAIKSSPEVEQMEKERFDLE